MKKLHFYKDAIRKKFTSFIFYSHYVSKWIKMQTILWGFDENCIIIFPINNHIILKQHHQNADTQKCCYVVLEYIFCIIISKPIIHFNDNRQKSTKFNFRFFIQYLSGLKKGILLGLLRSNIAHLWWVVMLEMIQLKRLKKFRNKLVYRSRK